MWLLLSEHSVPVRRRIFDTGLRVAEVCKSPLSPATRPGASCQPGERITHEQIIHEPRTMLPSGVPAEEDMDAALDFELERVLAHPLSPAPVNVLLPLAGSGNQLRPSKLWTGWTAVADRTSGVLFWGLIPGLRIPLAC